MQVLNGPTRCSFTCSLTSCYTTPRPSCVLLPGSCSLCLDGYTFCESNSSVLDHCFPGHLDYLSNFLCFAHRDLLVHDSWCVRRGIHGLLSIDIHAVVLKHIAPAFHATLPASAVILCPTVDGDLHRVSHMIDWFRNYF